MDIFRSISIAIVCIALLGGCASFEKEMTPRLSALPDVSHYTNKPSVDVDLAFFFGKPEDNPPQLTGPQYDNLQTVVAAAFDKSQLFQSYAFGQTGTGTSDYSISVRIYNHGDLGLAAVAGFISGFTFGVIPAAATDNYVVVLEVEDSSGNDLGRWANNDAVQTWIGIWFIPMMGNTPQKAVSNTLENQILTALSALFDADLLHYSGLPFAASHRG